MSSMICPVCRTEFAMWVARCSTCGIALVQAGERIDVGALPEDAQVVYELAEWDDDQRGTLGELLAESDVPHLWEGTDLVVADYDEALVDMLCAEIEGVDPDDVGDEALLDDVRDGLDGDVAGGGDDNDDDDDAPGEVTYELEEWTSEDRDRLELELRVGGVTATWEGTTLVVDASHEALVDGAIDLIAPPEPDAPEAPFEVLSELFVAADKLRHDASDQDGLRRLTAVIDTTDVSSAPFGVDDDRWDAIVDAADNLADLLADAADDADVEEQAEALRSLVRPFV
jgi:hypothetical protein